MVDILGGGRLDVGGGRGNRPVEFEGYRVPQIESRERFEEALAILVRAWAMERFSYEGRHYTIPEVRVIPKPLQQPHPPHLGDRVVAAPLGEAQNRRAKVWNSVTRLFSIPVFSLKKKQTPVT